MTASAETVVESLDARGRGVVRVDGKSLFVPGALPGERIRYRLPKRRRRGEVELEEILEPAPQRATPRCPHFAVCGACTLQHMHPEHQIAAKQQTLLESLERLGDVSPGEIFTPLTGPLWGYRRRARLGVRDVQAKGRVLVGFREKNGRYLADMGRCEVLDPQVGTRLVALSELLGTLGIRAQVPQIEVAVDDTTCALVFRVLEAPSVQDRKRMVEFARLHDLTLYLQAGGPETIEPLASNPDDLRYHIDDDRIEIRFRPADFTQVNGEINRSMIKRVLELLELHGEHRVLDLFCGLGNFTLPIARRVREVVGVEGDAGLVSRARLNAALNGIDNARFDRADLFADCSVAPWNVQPFQRVLLDPPRSGALQMLDAVAASGARRVVYVSCNPATLARDAGILVNNHGFELAGAGVIDMFPHTAHVESVALFIRDL